MDPLHPPVTDVLEFLQELYARGLGYSCLNTARSALFSFIVLDGNVTVGNHPLVQRFLKGVFQTRPAFPRYTSTWDTSIVLSYLKTLHPPRSVFRTLPINLLQQLFISYAKPHHGVSKDTFEMDRDCDAKG